MLLISEFGAFSSGKVAIIPKIGEAVASKNFGNLQSQVLSDQFKWPNNIGVVPQDVFGAGINAIVVPDGFLPPGKGNGNIYVMVEEGSKWINHQISTLKSGFFYHAGEWIDIDGDGRKDFLTARSNA